MKNPSEILLSSLDQLLEQPVDLVLFGRTALYFAFEAMREEYARTMDVDIILSSGQAEQLLSSSNFWDALEALNQKYADEGYYITHLFDESQIILRPDWMKHRVRIPGPWQTLFLYRPANEDLLLTKLMRYDPVDLQDARTICVCSGWSNHEIDAILASARVPEIPEILEQHDLCKRALLKISS
jgi:hypothetical protein